VSSKLKKNPIQSPIKDVKEEPESIVVEPNLHLEENDGNRFEMFIDFQSGGIGHFHLNYTILAVPGMRCNASRKPPSRSTSHEVR
jgi:hypothetical protein